MASNEKDTSQQEPSLATKERATRIESFTFLMLVFFFFIAIGFLMKVLASFLIPVVVAILMSSVCYSLVNTLNKRLHIPWLLGIVAVLLIVLLLVVALSSVITASITTFAKQYTNYEKVFLTVYKEIADRFDLEFQDDKNFFANMWGFGKVREAVQVAAVSVSSNIVAVVKNFGMVLLYVAFFLIEVRKGPSKINAIFHGKNSSRVTAIITAVVADVKSFLSTKFLISLITGVLVFVLCVAVGVNFAILWAFLAFVMNFIPTFGSIFSVGITTIVAFLQFFPNPAPTIFTFVILVAINMILGNIIEPRIEGDNLDISPFVILVSLTFWGWMWGFIGMIIAVPLMVIVKIICGSVLFPFLHPIAIMLGNAKKLKESPGK